MNWIYKDKEIKNTDDLPKGTIGFIYLIENLTNDKFYIGKKDLFHVTNPEISKKKYEEYKLQGVPVTKTKNRKLSKAGNPVWRYKLKNKTTETNWKTYKGSNQPLLEDISKGHKIRRTILQVCFSQKELTYRELEQIVKHDCLDRCDCYNGNILGKIYNFAKC